jgi:hypothetical protein
LADRIVHAVNSLIAFGYPYEHIHARKDRYSQRRPGTAHRTVRHPRYRRLGYTWDMSDVYTEALNQATRRIARWKGPHRAEEWQVSVAHDVDDRVWDFDNRPRDERVQTRQYWETFCVWLVLNPSVLKTWAGVDVLEGKIHRVVDCVEVWEDEPTLPAAYQELRRKVEFRLRVDRKLAALVACWGDC